MANPVIYFTVTNDLIYDQRMDRICTSLALNGFDVTLVGRKFSKSKEVLNKPYSQHRFTCFFTRGAIFYIEFNLRLFLYLLTKRADILCAIDLDTILPVLLVSKIRGSKRVYDAHELFCEMKEIVERPLIYKFWKTLERITVPRFKWGYTVNHPIATEFKRMYGVTYEVIRNVPWKNKNAINRERANFILYQGAVNEGRSFETLIPAMKLVDSKLVIAGDGNFMEQVKGLIKKYDLENKIELLGMVEPLKLKELTGKAKVGITIFERGAVSNFISLANRFFDYIQGGLPQVCADYPVYREINDRYEIALLTKDLSPEGLSICLNTLLLDQQLWDRLHKNCMEAAGELNWQNEETVLLNFYNRLVG